MSIFDQTTGNLRLIRRRTRSRAGSPVRIVERKVKEFDCIQVSSNITLYFIS